jgi:hypothetical protein
MEVFFTIRHYYLCEKKFDTFQADTMQQIRIIKPGASIAASGFKPQWCNACEGPLDVIVARSTTGKDKEGRRVEKMVRNDGEK